MLKREMDILRQNMNNIVIENEKLKQSNLQIKKC